MPQRLEYLIMIVRDCKEKTIHNIYFLFLSAMIIGFRHNSRFVSESDVPQGEDFLQLSINIFAVRTSERDHPFIFRVLESSSTATVNTQIELNDLDIFSKNDAIFGNIVRNRTDPIEVHRDLPSPTTTLPAPEIVAIRNDFIPEDTECFTIRILPVDVPGTKVFFICNEDNVGATDFFCQHTICIEDCDGGSTVSTYTIFILPPFFRSICCCVCGDNVHCG